MADASQTTYSPSDPSKWTTGPSEVDAALDELGDRAPSAITAWTDNAILRGDGTTAIQGSGATISDAGVALFPSTVTISGALNVSIINGWSVMMPGVACPIGFHAGNITDVTAMATRSIYFLYLGPVLQAFTTATINCKVTTAYVAGGAGTYAEVAIFSGDFGGVSGSPMTLRGYTDVATTYNSTGVKYTAVTISDVTQGMDLWAAFGCRSTGTLFQCRAYLSDDIQSGVAGLIALQRPSTLAAATTFSVTAEVAPWCSVVFS